MKLTMNNDVDLHKIGLKRTKDEEGTSVIGATMGISFVLDEEKCKKAFGPRFTKAAFNRDDAGVFLYRSFKPDDEFEPHNISFNKMTTQHTTPRIEGVEPIENEVRINISMRIDLTEDKFMTSIIKRLGSSVEISIEPTQLELLGMNEQAA